MSEFTERTSELAPGGGLSIDNVSGFGEDGTGELYIIDYGLFSNGEVYKMVPDPVFVGVGPRVEAPAELVLTGGRPNPFTRETRFDVLLDRAGDLEVSVFTAAGRLVRRLHAGRAGAGVVPLAWNGRDRADRTVPPGVYFLRAASSGRVVTERLTLLR